MKKTTLNRVLISIIIMLICSICFLIVCIVTRPRYINPIENETTVISEAFDELNAEHQNDSLNNITESSISDETSIPQIMYGKTSDKVNIRDAANADARVLETVEEGYSFEIIEILSNGWTKIKYNEMDAYISSSYVIIIKE